MADYIETVMIPPSSQSNNISNTSPSPHSNLITNQLSNMDSNYNSPHSPPSNYIWRYTTSLFHPSSTSSLQNETNHDILLNPAASHSYSSRYSRNRRSHTIPNNTQFTSVNGNNSRRYSNNLITNNSLQSETPALNWNFTSISPSQTPNMTFPTNPNPARNNSTFATKSPSAVSTRNSLIMNIRTQTWAAESHELFDYESRNIISNEFKCACMCDAYHIILVGSEIHFLPEHEAQNLYNTQQNAKLLARIIWSEDGHYYLLPPSRNQTNTNDDNNLCNNNTEKEEQKLWLVARYVRDRSVHINSGDVLKLGRFKLKVKEVVVAPKSKDNRFVYTTDDNDDCETVAPDPGDTMTHEAQAYSSNLSTHHKQHKNCVTFEEQHSVDSIGSKRIKKNKKYSEEYSKRFCRICLCCPADSTDYNAQLNPLVAPCECRGSMEWVHLECLRIWISGRLNIRNDSTSFFWKYLQCELCKVTYPTYVKVTTPDEITEDTETDEEHTSSKREDSSPLNLNVTHDNFNEPNSSTNLSPSESHSNVLQEQRDASRFDLPLPPRSPAFHDVSSRRPTQSIELFKFPYPEAPYIILEPQNEGDKGFYVVGLAHNRIARLGRGHESDVRLTDISISRLHSLLRYQKFSNIKRNPNLIIGSSGFTYSSKSSSGHFMIEDHHSKFGTLLLLQQPIRLNVNFPAISIQVSRTVIAISLRRRWRFRMPTCIFQRQHAMSSDIYVIFRQPQLAARAEPESTRPV